MLVGHAVLSCVICAQNMGHSEVERFLKEGPETFTDGKIDNGGRGELAHEVLDLCSKLYEIFSAFWSVISAASNVPLSTSK